MACDKQRTILLSSYHTIAINLCLASSPATFVVPACAGRSPLVKQPGHIRSLQLYAEGFVGQVVKGRVHVILQWQEKGGKTVLRNRLHANSLMFKTFL